MIRQEVLELLETLLDLMSQKRTGAAEMQLCEELQELGQTLLSAYGASLSFSDKATLRCLLLIDKLLARRQSQEQYLPVAQQGFLKQSRYALIICFLGAKRVRSAKSSQEAFRRPEKGKSEICHHDI